MDKFVLSIKILEMKKALFVIGLVAVMIYGCGEKKNEEVKKEVVTTVETVEETASSDEAILELGKKLFTEKTCATCHQPDAKVIGPSIKDINKIYSENDGDIVKFLKGETKAMVDTDPGQGALMQANIEGFVKGITDDELEAIKTYMLSVK